MLETLKRYHQILNNKNLTAAPDKKLVFVESKKFLEHQIKQNHKYPLKKTDF